MWVLGVCVALGSAWVTYDIYGENEVLLPVNQPSWSVASAFILYLYGSPVY